MYEQGDIVLVNFPLPDGFKLHPAVIVSNEEVYATEECYIGIMITSSKIRDNFSFELTNDMLSKTLRQNKSGSMSINSTVQRKRNRTKN